ncbi:two-component system histidine kinase [Amycolatopsis mediterranei S699]|uniref:histidine kinase n=2 Tax=Amycolatopsis mediterranei TaxID=33910 RepID=A0A0H3D1P2_AMYMU|nr:histidine kinase [Amycolatopsis mediterranei]ADJ44565.1 two-component system histidine kinase [Amycolatopsis mediterranei U32]AEK41304.1 two-component system histidine kinase [Amycolatopsis mediterranei S699]AFO76278.1 two-component system histidine kinase [Amycolatopsis mediterranei S699]AGT83407.1 two-component system histidine kinase [Amycolatopsis mediterranei RB]KDO07077.1 histidine kinase [Amycolatopsis mediterranei]
MSGFARSLLRPGGYRSIPYAVLGAVLAVPVAPFAVPWALLTGEGRSRALLAVLALAALLGLLGLTGPVRRFGVAVANGLLGTDLPAPGRARPAWPDRLRSGAWLVLHSGLGGLLLVVDAVLALGVLSPAMWLNGDQAEFTFFGAKAVAGPWMLPVALVMLVLALLVTAAATRAFQAGATALLGPSTTERTALAERRSAVLAQRNRLARELHDSIGHTLTTSTIQAAAAAELVEADPAQVRRALGTIEEASRSALEDLDHVLGLLREEPATKEPTRTLAEVDVLAVRAREAGLDVRLAVTGPVAALPAAVSREGYRIVQEGLTNALRHAGPGTVDVRVEAGPDRLGIAVVNALPGDGPRTGRRGLAGLAERVEALRGELDAGPDGGQWRLSATIPLRAAA